MLKNQEIIEKLTTEQKLDLIVNVTSLGDVSPSEYGIRFLKTASLQNKESWLEYPSFSGLVNSWDINLIGKVADDVLTSSNKAGTTLMELPNVSFKVSPYSNGISEDPLLSASIASELALAGNRNGVATCLCDPIVEIGDSDYIDKKFSKRIYNEFFGLPYELLKNSKIKALKLSKAEKEWEYTKANANTIATFANKATVISDGAERSSFVRLAVNEGQLFINGCREALNEAIDNYNRLMKSFEACEISLADVNKACETGMALSPEMIDTAVDKILCFAESCRITQKPNEQITPAERARRKREKPLSVIAGEDSIVLLKNEEEILPLKPIQKVCLIGKVAEAEGGVKDFLLSKDRERKISFIGYEPGYGDSTDISEDRLVDAEKLATKSSIVLIAVGLDEKHSQQARKDKNMRLPANQEALINKIYGLGKKVILLVYGENSYDMAFDQKASGVILVPHGGRAMAEATFNVIYGKGCPGGRLANTLYENTDKVFKDIKRYKDSGRNEIGLYYGYRLYTTLQQEVKYPFGYGLSYTTFKYSKLKIRKGIVSLEVKNKGRKEGSELIQIYISKPKTDVMRAERELKAFFKVRLRPRERKTITFKISDLNLNVYSEKKKYSFFETGEYELSVCANACEVILKTKFSQVGETTSEKFVRSNYLQNVSNIKDGEYYFEEPTPAPKFVYERTERISKVLSCVMIFALSIYAYLYAIKWANGNIIELLIMAGLTAFPLILAKVMRERRNSFIKKHIEKNKIMKKEKRSKLNFDLICEEIPYEQLFIEEFETPVIELEKEEVVVVENKDEAFINEVFNPNLTMFKATEELNAYVKERGIYVDIDSIRSVYASLTASRLIVLNAEDRQLLSRFIELLCEYFSCENISIDFSSIFNRNGDVINTANGITPIAQALIDEGEAKDKVRLMTIQNIACEDIKPCLQQVIRYIEQPEKDLTFSVLSDGKTYPIPHNVWFILTLSEEQKAIDIPKYILESASVIDLNMRPVEEVTSTISEETTASENQETTYDSQPAFAISQQLGGSTIKTPVELVNYYQFTKMIDVAMKNNLLDEVLWKRLDKLEDYVISLDPLYRINNKMWQRIERFVSAYLCAGGSNEEAIDNVVAYQVINTMVTSVANSTDKENVKFAHLLESVFGEGNVPHSIKAIKATGLKV